MSGTTIAINFNKDLWYSSANGWSVVANGVAIEIASVLVSAKRIILTLVESIESGETVEVLYDAATGDAVDTVGVFLGDLALTAITNNSVATGRIAYDSLEMNHDCEYKGLDEAVDGKRLLDGSLEGNHGKLYSGRAMSFDGVGDWEQIPAFDPTGGSGTKLSCFISAASITGATKGIFTQYENAKRAWQLGIASGKLRIVISGDGNYGSEIKLYVSSIDIDDGDYHRVGFTWDSGTLKLYVDGVEDASVTKTTDDNFTNMTVFTSDLGIGKSAGYSDYVDGDMANAQLWNVAWDSDDVAYDYNNPELLASSRSGTSLTTANLKGWWPLADGFSDSNYDTILDHSGNGNHGANVSAGATHLTAQGPELPQMALQGWSRKHVLDIDVIKNVNLGNGAALQIGSDKLVLSAWVLTNYDAGNNPFILSKRFSYASDESYTLYLDNSSPDRTAVCAIRADGTRYSLTGSSKVNDGILHHVCAVYDGVTLKLFVDSVEEDSVEVTGDIDVNSTDDALIGGGVFIGNEYPQYRWRGFLDEIAIFDEFNVFGLTQVQELYNNGIPLNALEHSQAVNLVGYWRNTGRDTWEDLSTNSNDGTVNGSPDVIHLPEGPTAGKDGLGFPLTNPRDVDCLNLDGAGYVEVDDDTSLNVAGTFTVSAWVKLDDLGVHSALLWKKDPTSDTNGFLIFHRNNNDLVVYGSSINDAIFSTDQLVIGIWKYCVFLFEGADVTYYANGIYSGKMVGDIASVVASPDALRIGITHTPSSPCKGQIAHPVIYDRALTAAEIEAIYNSQKATYGL